MGGGESGGCSLKFTEKQSLHTAAYLPCGVSRGAARQEDFFFFFGVTDTASASAKEAETLGGLR